MQNETIRVTATDTNENGAGFVRIDRLALFVEGMVSGDTADVEITEMRKNYATGRIVQLIEPSPFRIKPLCPSYSECGGCTLSHVSFDHENEIKLGTIHSAFRRMHLPYDRIVEMRHTEERTGYRNKLGVHYDRKYKAFGYNAFESHKALPFTGCQLADRIMNDVIVFTNSNITLLDSVDPRELYIRKSCDSRYIVSLYTEQNNADIGRYREELIKAFGDMITVISIGPNKKSSETVCEEYDGINMRIASESFRQVNHEAAEILLKTVNEYASLKEFKYAADLYCGSGMFGLNLAHKNPSARIIGIEIDKDAILSASANAAANGIENIEFHCGDAADLYEKSLACSHLDLAVVDPPRAGLSSKMREGLIALSPDRIIYVSCNPQTLARDISELSVHGYEIEAGVGVNMFPGTAHVETVVLLSKHNEIYA